MPLHRKEAQEAWLQPGGASGRRDRENTWDSGRCESGKTGSLHWLSEKAGSHREKKESGTWHLLREEIRTDFRQIFRRVIIIDDIYTTGNTVDQVAKVLKTMGLQKVYFLTISIGQGY